MLINYNINLGMSQRLWEEGKMKSKHEPQYKCLERKLQRAAMARAQPPLRRRAAVLEAAPSSAAVRDAALVVSRADK